MGFPSPRLSRRRGAHIEIENYFAAIARIGFQIAMQAHDQHAEVIKKLRAAHHDAAADFIADGAVAFVKSQPLHDSVNAALQLAVEGFTQSIERRRSIGAVPDVKAIIQKLPWSAQHLFVPRPDKDYSFKSDYDVLAGFKKALAKVPRSQTASASQSTSGGGGGGGKGGGGGHNNRPSFPGRNNNNSTWNNNNSGHQGGNNSNTNRNADGRFNDGNTASQPNNNHRNHPKGGAKSYPKKGGGGGRGSR